MKEVMLLRSPAGTQRASSGCSDGVVAPCDSTSCTSAISLHVNCDSDWVLPEIILVKLCLRWSRWRRLWQMQACRSWRRQPGSALWQTGIWCRSSQQSILLAVEWRYSQRRTSLPLKIGSFHPRRTLHPIKPECHFPDSESIPPPISLSDNSSLSIPWKGRESALLQQVNHILQL